MTTDPGDLVLDPTCGSGTTAYVAEQWGRRWITIDTSRVPLALARQRLLTATFPWYELKDERAGRPAGSSTREAEQEGRGGRRHRPARHAEEHRQQRAARRRGPRRSPRARRAHRPRHRPVHRRGDDPDPRRLGRRRRGGHRLPRRPRSTRRSSTACSRCCGESPVLHLRRQGAAVTLKQRPASRPRRCSLSAEGGRRRTARTKPVALVFGPENGAVSEKLVHEALQGGARSRATRTSTSSASPSSRTRAS